MTYPRSHLVDPEGGHYHVCSRCVRRAWLCGNDEVTGTNYDHRRAWIENRILELTNIFAVDIFGYAVMSNHYHIVLNIESARTRKWTDSEVVMRWAKLSTSKNKSHNKNTATPDKKRIEELRHRLSSLSWFMRYINEPLARQANREDNCKGRFWEGRFNSQRLLDEQGLLGAMVYVDLNPVRAGISDAPVASDYTSIKNAYCAPRAG